MIDDRKIGTEMLINQAQILTILGWIVGRLDAPQAYQDSCLDRANRALDLANRIKQGKNDG